MINIFVKIFNNFDLCKLLFNEFKKFLKKQKEFSQNLDLINENEDFQNINDKIKEICNIFKRNKIIRENKDISADYYGFILYYYYNYDSREISKLVKYIYAQDSDILFQILSTYKFLNKNINDEKIIEELIKFTTYKTYNDLVGGLIYLKNLEQFLNIINKNKEKLISIQNFQPLPIKNLERPKNIKKIISLLKEIINFSKENNQLLIDFNHEFWANLINICNSSSLDNIINLNELRKLFETFYSIKKGPYLENSKTFSKKNEFKIKIKDLINSIIKKYDKLIIKSQINPISSLKETELKMLIETLSELAIFSKDNEIYNINLFEKITQLNEEIQDRIYTELYYKYNDEKHKEEIINKIVKQYYIKKLESKNFDIFISFIEKLEYDDYKDMMNRINNAYEKREIDDNFILLCMLNYEFIKKEEENIEKLNQELKKEKDKNENNEKILKEQYKYVKRLNDNIQKKTKLYEDLKIQYDEVSNNLKQKNNDEKNIIELYKDLEEEKRKIENLDKELKGVKDENEELKNELNEEKKKNERLTIDNNNNSEESKKYDELFKKYERLNQEKNDNKKNLEEKNKLYDELNEKYKNEKEALTNELNKKEQLYNELITNYSNEKKNNKNLNEENKQLLLEDKNKFEKLYINEKYKNEQLIKENSEEKDKNNYLNQKISELEEEKKKIKNDFDKINSENSKYKEEKNNIDKLQKDVKYNIYKKKEIDEIKKKYIEDNNIIINDNMKNNNILINDINMNNKNEKKEHKNDSSLNIFKNLLHEKSHEKSKIDKIINELINNYSNEKEIYELKIKEKENQIKLPPKLGINTLISFILKLYLFKNK